MPTNVTYVDQKKEFAVRKGNYILEFQFFSAEIASQKEMFSIKANGIKVSDERDL